MFVWRRFVSANWRIQARALSAAGVLGPVQTLSDAGAFDDDAGGARVAVAFDGNAVVVWARDPGGIQARALSAAGVLGPIQTLSDGPIWTWGTPNVAVDPDGDAAFVWRDLVLPNENRIRARTRSAAGALGPVQILHSGKEAVLPKVAVDFDGDAVFVWRLATGKSPIQGRALSATGVLGPVQTLARNGPEFPEVAVGADGGAVFVWRRFDGTNFRIQARTRSAAGVLGPVQTLSRATNARVAVAKDGSAIVVWQRFDGTNSRIQAAAGP